MVGEIHVTQPLLIEHDEVDRVTLNRPDSLNALDPADRRTQCLFRGLQHNRSTMPVVLKAQALVLRRLDLKHAMARRPAEPPGVTESLDSQRRIADIVI
jgi:hypothetical protein